MFGTPESTEPAKGEISFHAANRREYAIPAMFGANISLPISPKYHDYVCGACGQSTSGRVLCDLQRVSDDATILWCKCSCDRQEPTVIVQKDGTTLAQLPQGCEFTTHGKWPPEIAKLFDEAVKSYAAGAFTAASMVCRKVLMNCACLENAKEGIRSLEAVGPK